MESAAAVCRESPTESTERSTTSAEAKMPNRSLGSFIKGSEVTSSTIPTSSLQQTVEAELSSYLLSPVLDSEENPLGLWRTLYFTTQQISE